MIIKSIELENIRSYEKETIEFEDGINFLSGDIGSGKTSILYAIEFALLGFKRGDLEGFQLLRKGKNKGSVKLVLFNSKNGECVEIVRNLKRAKKSDSVSQENGSVLEGGNLVELSPLELNAYVFNILNFPKEFLTKDKNLVYRFTVYTPQEQLKEILFTGSDKRLEVVRKIFAIDKYKQLCDAISLYFVQLRERKKVFQVRLEPKDEVLKCVERFEKEVLEHERKVGVYGKKEILLKDKLDKHKAAIVKRDDLLDRIRKNLVLLEKKKTRIEEIEESLKEDVENLEVKEKKFCDLDSLDFRNRLDELKDLIKDKDVQIGKIEKERKICEKGLSEEEKFDKRKREFEDERREFELKKDKVLELQKSCDYMLVKCQIKDVENFVKKDEKLVKKILKLKVEVEDLQKKVIQCESQIDIFKKDVLLKRKRLDSLEGIKVCESCFQEVSLEHKKKIREKVESEVCDLEEKIEELIFDRDKCKKEFDDRKGELDGLDLLEKGLIEKREKLRSLEQSLKKEKEVYDNFKKLRSEVLVFEKGIGEFEKNEKEVIEKIAGFKVVREKIAKLTDERLFCSEELGRLKVEFEKVENSVKDKDNLKKEIDVLKHNVKVKSKVVCLKDDVSKKLVEYRKKEDVVSLKRKELVTSCDLIYDELRDVSGKKSSELTQVDNLKKLIAEKSLEIDELKKVEGEYKALLDVEFFLANKVVNVSNLIERAAFTKYYCSFTEEFESLFRSLIEDSDIDVRLDSEFSPVIEQNGYDVDVKNLSGGEKSSLAVAYRLGLKKIIESSFESRQRLSILILDEPTDGFSNEQIDRLGNVLKESNMKQIILVSHDEKIESIADNVLKVNKVNHVSGVL